MTNSSHIFTVSFSSPTMSGRPATRARQILIPTELRKRTREEIREEKEAKERLAKEKKEKACSGKSREAEGEGASSGSSSCL